jgi:uncharacterized protein (TIGR02145 family)
MKKHILQVIVFGNLFMGLLSMVALAQESFDYVAVVRDSAGVALPNQTVEARVSIIQGSPGEEPIYIETHSVVSNAAGYITLPVGTGTIISGTFDNIPWQFPTLFIKIEVDINAGTDYQEVGTTQLVSVPYALYTSGLTISNEDGKEFTLEVDTTGDLSANEHGPCGPSLTMTDPRDGKVYDLVEIGLQCWFKENLDVGTMINSATDQTNNGALEKYCYNNDTNNCHVYGALYQWGEMMSYTWVFGGQGICPPGFHVPSDEEWDQLAIWVGTMSPYWWEDVSYWYAGGKLKETGTAHWTSPNTDATNESGFTALGAGYWNNNDNAFYGLNTETRIYASTATSPTERWMDRMTYNSHYLYNNWKVHPNDANSVRCVKGEYVDPCKGITSVSHGGQLYHTSAIGTQCWIKENMNIGVFEDDNFKEPENNGVIEHWCWGNDPYWCSVMGGLYNWNEAMKYFYSEGSQGICPSGFHIPTDQDFRILEGYADSKFMVDDPVWGGTGPRGWDVGMNLKADWGWQQCWSYDAFGFYSVGGGSRWCDGAMWRHYRFGYYWTSSYAGNGSVWVHSQFGNQVSTYCNNSYRDQWGSCHGLSVKCVKD